MDPSLIPSFAFDHVPEDGHDQLQLLSPAPSAVSDDASRWSEYSVSTTSTDEGNHPNGGRTKGGNKDASSKSSKRRGNRVVRHRKAHRKSTQGCSICKTRRIKCDEAKPSCQNCDKKGLRCEYPKPTPRPIIFAEPVILTPSSMGQQKSSRAAVAKSAKSTKSDTSASTELIQRSRSTTPSWIYQIDLPDINLMHVFNEETTEALMMPDIWRKSFIHLAMKYDFAMSSLMMFSAGHVARQLHGPDQYAYRVQELEHRQRALQTMRDQLDAQVPSNEAYDALLGTSLLLAFHSCSFSNFEVLDPSADGFLLMLNGVKQIVKHMWVMRHESAFKRLFAMPLAPKHDESLRYGFESLFVNADDPEDPRTGQRLKINWELETRYLPDYQIYRRILASLLPLLDAVYGETGFLAADSGSATFCALVAWPILQADRFFAMLRQGDPKALILAAHYYAALLKLEPGSSWWLHDRPREMCRAICYKLGKEYRQWLQLPLDMLDSVDGNTRHSSPESPHGSTPRRFRPNIPLTKPRYTVLERLTVTGVGEKKWVFC